MILSAAIISSVISEATTGLPKKHVNWESFDSSILIEVNRGGDVFTCSGVLIDQEVILTAAHCVDGITTGRVIFDHEYNPKTDNFIKITGHIIHPGYDKKRSNYGHDLALVFLDKKILNLTPAKINWTPKLKVTSELERIGFGGREKQNIRTWTNPKFVQVIEDGSILSLKDEYSVIGDSGGPIFQVDKDQPELVGIHSTLEGNKKTYAVYLPFYKEWISKYL